MFYNSSYSSWFLNYLSEEIYKAHQIMGPLRAEKVVQSCNLEGPSSIPSTYGKSQTQQFTPLASGGDGGSLELTGQTASLSQQAPGAVRLHLKTSSGERLRKTLGVLTPCSGLVYWGKGDF